MNDLIPENFDDFMKPEPETGEEKTEKETLEVRFSGERLSWSTKVKEMSGKLKKALDVAELMTEIYTERQRALEYYHYLISLLIKINKNYRKAYAERHEYYSYKSQKRFTNEPSKNNQIQTDLEGTVEKREMLDNHAKFMDGSIKTMDSLIFGMKTRIDIEQIARGK
jgi:hypothetical protein